MRNVGTDHRCFEGLFALIVFVAAASGATWAGADDGEAAETWQGRARDAWIDGKIEASFALNRYLNPFEIDTEVDRGVVRLSGEVESEIDKSLAGEIAEGIDGVVEVENDIAVRPETKTSSKKDAAERSFAQRFDDANTTARVKIALLADGSTEGLSIDVDTENGTVSLEGMVASAQERELAERIAGNTEGVVRVENRLKIRES